MAKQRATTRKSSVAAGRKKILQRIRKEIDAAHRAAVNKLTQAGKKAHTEGLVGQYYKIFDQHAKFGGYFKAPWKR
jgi:hypothetical protein